MTNPTFNRPKVFIEKIMPVELLNRQVYHENGGNPFKGLHRWFSRKPLSFSRASVLASLLPADISMDDFEYLLGLERRKYRSNEVKLYKTPPSPERIKQVHDLCEKVWGKRTPTVLDAFAGNGSIPFEAVRYGFNVLASDLNPVAVVTMKAVMEYPLKFGSDLQQDIDKWVKWVGDEAEKRLAEFFPCLPGEKIQHYLWAHTVVCPSCESIVPLSPNWWLYRRSEKQNLHKWCAVKPIPNFNGKQQVEFELIKGKKGKLSTIETDKFEYDPTTTITINGGVGKCLSCDKIIEEEAIKHYAQSNGLGHILYAVAYKKGNNAIEFRLAQKEDFEGLAKAEFSLDNNKKRWEVENLLPQQEIPLNTHRGPDMYLYGIYKWTEMFNSRQLLTTMTYLEVIKEAKKVIYTEYDSEMAEAITTYLALILDRYIDKNSRLSHLDAATGSVKPALGQHSLNLFWNYPEISLWGLGWNYEGSRTVSDYLGICELLTSQKLSLLDKKSFNSSASNLESLKIHLNSADRLTSVADKTIDVIVTDPPYYDSLRYAEISDFFYVWLRANLLDTLPNLFFNELTDKDSEAIANPGRFRNMGESPEKLAKQDYEAKMALAFAEYFRVLRDDGVMTVQFNHKDSGAWDVLTKSLIDAGFEITASWAVSTENPQNLHQAKKNSVSSTVLLVCRKRDPKAAQAWWDDLRPEVANLVELRAPEYEANDITGIDLYLSAFGPALNVFSRSHPILDSSGEEVRPEVAFAEARKAIANYRFRKLVQSDTAGFDSLTQWYLLAWDAFKAREFPFDEARQLALAIGGFNLSDLAKTHKLLDSTSGTCQLLTPQQRLKKRAFSVNEQEFSALYLVDGLHAVLAIYQEEQNIQLVRRFMKNTGLVSNDMFMKTMEVAFKVLPETVPEQKALLDLWLAMDDIKAKVVVEQMQLPLEYGQLSLDFTNNQE